MRGEPPAGPCPAGATTLTSPSASGAAAAGTKHLVEAAERTMVVPSVPSSVASVRRYTVAACHRGGLDVLADTAALLVSEVATNALVHACGDVRVTATVNGRSLRVEVSDDDPALPAPRRASATDEGGRGLALLEALAGSWGTEPRPDGKTVWFILTA